MKTLKVLVTGGAGFIGSHLCERLLNDGHTVFSLDNMNDYYDRAIKEKNLASVRAVGNERFLSVEGDIRDTAKVDELFSANKPDLVIHLAAMAGVRPSIKDPGLYWDVNVRGTQVIFDACVKHAVKHVLFASSSSVYGNNKKVPFSEADSVDHPISPYAATKKTGELMAHTYKHLYGLSIVCLRFFTVYGPRQRPDLAIHKFSRLILEGAEIPYYGDGSAERDYTYVGDILDGVIKSMEWTRNSPAGTYDIFNLGESRTISLKEMVSTLENAWGKPANIKKLPMQPGDVNRTYADISKAKNILEYNPVMSFEEGIASFADWLKENL